ncbi:MAG: Hsp70 family protein [Planctomycetaceae bacterium]|jgi:molecular chaperone DnaK|nr:Hsp70 family protein [Planctomycetaceae bacterium]MBT4724886.1 Hsp70 family protein [Planctomycetaceae bacterium]MBT5124943.1 Hsp70 family protein [Planctomycetaceae bacterium]MBT5885752.1 Hsp70 family protein [Planctomycetaceae bacterium]MBT6848625.1 Hsp70 family protein [Planctomycetaceae bacterium]
MAIPIIGIDLGTTYSAVATINVADKPEIIENTDGLKTTASAILFEDPMKPLVGQNAIDAGLPELLAWDFKRKMGDANWSSSFADQEYSAVDLSAMVLRKLANDASFISGKITKAVITVPAYFEEIQRKATKDAAELAGLEVIALINEPTAAALAYAATGVITGRVLVYDFGGGTFDASIVDIAGKYDVTVLTSEGDNDLGGRDIDRALAEHIDELCFAQHGKHIVDSSTRWDLLESPDSYALVMEAVSLKHKLSARQQVNGVKFVTGDGDVVDVDMSRDIFEASIKSIIHQTEMAVDVCLSNKDIFASDIDYVLMVGGSTRIPAVQAMLERKFGKPPIRSINPDEAVALGAAIYAASELAKTGEVALPDFGNATFTDVASHSHGTFVIDDSPGYRRNDKYSIIIPKDSPIPCKKTESFYTAHDNQTAVDVSVVQGDDDNPEFLTTLVNHEMPLPSDRPAGKEIQITFEYDKNNMVHCSVLDVESGNRQSFPSCSTAGGDTETKVPINIDPKVFDDLEF